MLTFKFNYFILFLLLFLVESMIAIFVHDAIVRPFIGDFLAVILLFFLLKTFLNCSSNTLICWSLGIAYLLECLQYINFLDKTGLASHKIVAVVLGTSFDWKDILAYTAGAMFLFYLERKMMRY